jgi:Na+-driven multidrug efflux pump
MRLAMDALALEELMTQKSNSKQQLTELFNYCFPPFVADASAVSALKNTVDFIWIGHQGELHTLHKGKGKHKTTDSSVDFLQCYGGLLASYGMFYSTKFQICVNHYLFRDNFYFELLF